MNTNRKARNLKLSLLVVLMFMVALFGPSSALAAGNSITISQNIPFAFSVYVDCAAGGVGEWVDLSGYLHDLFHLTFDSSGGIHVAFLDNPQGVSGYGELTGAKYQATGETRDNFNALVGYEETYVNNFKIIGMGTGNNFLVHETFHVTVNANGTLTAYVDNFSVTCK